MTEAKTVTETVTESKALPTLAQIEAEVRRLADEQPDRKATCMNWDFDDDGNKVGVCIVGSALINLGADVERLSKNRGVCSTLQALGHAEIPDLDPSEDDSDAGILGWLVNIQDAQDRDNTWSEAKALADRYRTRSMTGV